ncbi:MAG: peptidoglycan glycosyltransferase [Runella slithyformis]|nr:MAG: peptidoglycan glycosyltransferase [Runella slithyformis]TAF25446.1 MAG: peptidoglycan glycosyltransferase [Runella slithyformis]TAF43723.1 MAG: peptidoglycan glycosyltransferase [Runella slithyformis]TAF79834.1 MAG: peptidoglycan glycosyltransferase [Runella slithyformis]
MISKTNNIREDIARRSWVVSSLLIIVAILIVGRIVYVQHYAKYKGKPWVKYMANTVRIDTIPAMRGNIYSSDGSLLATSLPYYEVSIDPAASKKAYFYSRIDSLATLFANAFGQRTKEDYLRELKFARHEFEVNKKKGNRNVRLLNRQITFREYQMITTQQIQPNAKATRGWPFFRQFNNGETRGGKLPVFYRRYLPFGNLAARTIGYLDRATYRGLVGLEASFDRKLSGTPGVGLFRVLDDKTFMPFEESEKLQPTNGYDLYTTLDVNFQDIAESSLRKTLNRYQADYGTVIVMEVQTGAIKAMVNLALSKKDTGYAETFNYALAQPTNPGSTFKLATLVAALEEGKVSPATAIQTGNGSTTYGRVTITDTKAHGTITVQQVLEQSSNVGTHLIMQRSGFYTNPYKYMEYLKKFHLTQPTGVAMLGEAPPLAPQPKTTGWDGTSATRLSYGYVWEITPLQTLSFYNAIANNGYWVRPMIVQEVRNANEVIQAIKPQVLEQRIASEQTIRRVQKMLEGVVADKQGTGHVIHNDQYQIAGKTGTAQLIINNTYSKVGKYNVSFAGYFPAKSPKYSCIVFVSHPKGGRGDNLYAGSVAAPVFKEVADRIVGYDVKMHPPVPNKKNNVKETNKQLRAGQADDLRTIAEALNTDAPVNVNGWVMSAPNTKKQWTNTDTNPNKIPNLRGMSLRDALYLLENHGFKVNYQGMGKITDYTLKNGVYALILK